MVVLEGLGGWAAVRQGRQGLVLVLPVRSVWVLPAALLQGHGCSDWGRVVLEGLGGWAAVRWGRQGPVLEEGPSSHHPSCRKPTCM
jgi:hypothetical protein